MSAKGILLRHGHKTAPSRAVLYFRLSNSGEASFPEFVEQFEEE